MYFRAGVCTLRNLYTAGGSRPIDVLIVHVIPAAPESLGMWLSKPSGTGHLVNGHVTVEVFVYLNLCAGLNHCGKFKLFVWIS